MTTYTPTPRLLFPPGEHASFTVTVDPTAREQPFAFRIDPFNDVYTTLNILAGFLLGPGLAPPVSTKDIETCLKAAASHPNDWMYGKAQPSVEITRIENQIVAYKSIRDALSEAGELTPTPGSSEDTEESDELTSGRGIFSWIGDTLDDIRPGEE